jgi:hypothetical protein
MGLWPFGKNAVTQTFEFRGAPRPVRAEVVEVLDNALARIDLTEVTHAIVSSGEIN